MQKFCRWYVICLADLEDEVVTHGFACMRGIHASVGLRQENPLFDARIAPKKQIDGNSKYDTKKTVKTDHTASQLGSHVHDKSSCMFLLIAVDKLEHFICIASYFILLCKHSL